MDWLSIVVAALLGAVLGHHVGRLPSWAIHLLTIVAIVGAIVLVATQTQL